MFRAYPRVVVWRPFVSIHSFDPSSPFPLILRKTKETNAFRFRRCIKLIVALIHTTSFHHICSHCILCKQDALSTRKYLCACARFRSAVTLKGPISLGPKYHQQNYRRESYTYGEFVSLKLSLVLNQFGKIFNCFSNWFENRIGFYLIRVKLSFCTLVNISEAPPLDPKTFDIRRIVSKRSLNGCCSIKWIGRLGVCEI